MQLGRVDLHGYTVFLGKPGPLTYQILQSHRLRPVLGKVYFLRRLDVLHQSQRPSHLLRFVIGVHTSNFSATTGCG
jgi:hypothetical protein